MKHETAVCRWCRCSGVGKALEHEQCSEQMHDEEITAITGTIMLPYSKQGDDFERIKVGEDMVDALASLEAHRDLLDRGRKQLDDIARVIRGFEAGEVMDMWGGGHFIYISGPAEVMRELIIKELVVLESPQN